MKEKKQNKKSMYINLPNFDVKTPITKPNIKGKGFKSEIIYPPSGNLPPTITGPKKPFEPPPKKNYMEFPPLTQQPPNDNNNPAPIAKNGSNSKFQVNLNYLKKK